MSMSAPFVVKSGSSHTGNKSSSNIAGGNDSASSHTTTMLSVGPSREMTGNRLFQFYMESFFKIPKDIKNDIIYCQRALKAHIKVHQMVLDVFEQQPDADPQQKKRILDELESEIYEINAEQSFLFIRLRRIIDEFYKMLKKNGIPTDTHATNALVSKEIVPFVSDTSIHVLPVAVLHRSTEDKLIEKYFEVQKDSHQQPEPVSPQCMEIINLDDDGCEEEYVPKSHHSRRSGQKREYPCSTASITINDDGLFRNFNAGLSQTSLLKPMNQRVANEIVPVDVKPKFSRTSTLSHIYNQQNEKEEEKEIQLPISTNVRMSRMNLRQALKRAQAAARGPAIAPPPPPPPPPAPLPVVVVQPNQKISAAKARAARAKAAAASASAAAAALIANKSPENTSSSGEGTPERESTPPQAYWPDELEETRTKADEYGQEMFLQMFDLFTPEVHAQMQQRRSKRRRRCVKNKSYHYGASATSCNDPDPKKKRKAFLLSPQIKKALPNKRNKRRSADNASESNSVPPSRSASSSPDDKRSCNECFKGGYILELCEHCKSHYHPQCHREEDDPHHGTSRQDVKQILSEPKICPTCKRNNDKIIKKEIMINKNLHTTAQELQLKMSKEKERREALQKTGKSYKIQMNNLFKIVNSLKSEVTSTSISTNSTASNSSKLTSTTANNYVIQLD